MTNWRVNVWAYKENDVCILIPRAWADYNWIDLIQLSLVLQSNTTGQSSNKKQKTKCHWLDICIGLYVC